MGTWGASSVRLSATLRMSLQLLPSQRRKGKKKSASQHPQMARCKLGWQDAPFAMLCGSVELAVTVTLRKKHGEIRSVRVSALSSASTRQKFYTSVTKVKLLHKTNQGSFLLVICLPFSKYPHTTRIYCTAFKGGKLLNILIYSVYISVPSLF